MRALVIGYGSIGKRHVKILNEMSHAVKVVTRTLPTSADSYDSIKTALDEFNPNYIVIAVETHRHYPVVCELAKLNFKGKVLIEKPLFVSNQEFPHNSFQKIGIAYNLRFHPIIKLFKEILKVNIKEKVISANFYVGSFLPQWRASRDYSKTYSASKHKGGGVLRDLSHELDLVIYLFGYVNFLTALGGKFGNLEIDSDDSFTLLMETKKCPCVVVSMGYNDRLPLRRIIVTTDSRTIILDLNNYTINSNGKLYEVPENYDSSYSEMHESFLKSEDDFTCNLKEGLMVNKIIDNAEIASNLKQWINLER